ncbi:hypothetical protein VTK73DRAFT_4080 [Phialemonium thermophilum]|uniref:Ribosomal RNA-processing protein 14/surfeit locus protein 6 C-terminal domain-containing protein n=1 Tax=Phialemonium thermophilum TaxID=223376 RepID=A0ABR3WV72_9PEZI
MSESPELKDRLREHAKAFDGLLSLIPAKMYYGEDTSDQWKRKKRSKSEAKAAKRGRLDPDSELNRNAKEVMDERARNKRKLKELEDDAASGEDEDDDDADISPVVKEKPGEGLKKRPSGMEALAKKQKILEDADGAQDEQQSKKQQTKAEKKLQKKQKKEEQAKSKAGTTGIKDQASHSRMEAEAERAQENGQATQSEDASRVVPTTESEQADEPESGEDMEKIDIAGLAEPEEDAASTVKSVSNSPIFDDNRQSNKDSAEPTSTTTSISSTVPPSEKPKHIKLPTDTTALRARLAAKIEALRAARKADVDGKPIRTRQELIESRREKQAQRKAHKKELRRLAKAEEERKREEALASARNSPAMLSPLVDIGADDDGSANHFAFGRVAFADGTQMSHDLTYAKDSKKRKGPSDPKTALAKLEAQKRRIAALDEDKRKEVLEKETWLAARRRAEGERVRDDEALLKKAVKRKEKAKKKSEREWKERTRGVETAIRERQRKREENLRKRREEKGAGKGKKKAGGGTKKKGRPGFEGSFGGGGKRK